MFLTAGNTPAGVLCEIVKATPTDSWHNLLATNRQLRHLVQGCVSSAQLKSCQDVVLLDSWQHLTHLSLSGILDLQAVHYAMLAQGHTSNLQALDLSHTAIRDVEAQQLAMGSWLHLTSLDLSNSAMDSRAAMQLSGGSWPALSSLNLAGLSGYDSDTAAAARYLATGKWQLTALDVSNNKMGHKSWTELITGWPKLRVLNVGNCRCLDRYEHVAELAAMQWPCLSHLDLSYNRLGKGFRCLNQAQWPQLTRLELTDVSFDIALLPQIEVLWQNLRHLTLKTRISGPSHGHKHTLDEIFALISSPGQALHSLHVACAATRAAINARPQADSWPPDTEIHMAVGFVLGDLESLAAGFWPIVSLFVCCQSGWRGLTGAAVNRCATALDQVLQLSSSSIKSFVYMSMYSRSDWHSQALQAVCEVVVKAEMPFLNSIQVEAACMTDAHVFMFSAGNWPLLKRIAFIALVVPLDNSMFNDYGAYGSEVTLHGVLQLMRGDWPSLVSIVLPAQIRSQTLSLAVLYDRWPDVTVRIADVHTKSLLSVNNEVSKR